MGKVDQTLIGFKNEVSARFESLPCNGHNKEIKSLEARFNKVERIGIVVAIVLFIGAYFVPPERALAYILKILF